MKTSKIGFIGGGNMATSLARGLIASGHAPDCVWVSDVNEAVLAALATSLHVHTTQSNVVVAAAVEVLVLAVKPQILQAVALEVAATVRNKPCLVVSIAAGVNLRSLAAWLGTEVAIVRCMPNTPALVMSGATVLFANDRVTPEQRSLAENILRAVGMALWVEDESLLDVVTAVSGSGPAYFFLLMEAMTTAAVDMGLEPEMARLLVQQTGFGAAKIALEANEAPEVLRQRVTSPGGTTERAINTFAEGGFIELVGSALMAAHVRAVEMSEQMEND